MTRGLLTLLLAVVFNLCLSAQSFLGQNGSGWGTLSTLSFNPVFADSRNKFNLHLFAIDMSMATDLSGLSKNGIWELNSNYMSTDLRLNTDLALKDDAAGELSGETFNLYRQTHFQGPSLIIPVTRNKWQHALAFSTNMHSLVNYRNVDADQLVFFEALSSGSDLAMFGTQHEFQGGEVLSAAWADYVLSYSSVLLNTDKHALKVGFSLKFLQGLGASALMIDELQYLKGTAADDLAIQGSVTYAQSEGKLIGDNGNVSFAGHAAMAVAVDVGIIYAWQPRKANYSYDMDGKTGLFRKDVEDHTLALGLAVADLGESFKYRKTRVWSDFGPIFYITDATALKASIDQEGAENLLETIFSSGAEKQKPDVFEVKLPTRFNIFVDYQPVERLHLGLNAVIMANSGSAQIRYPNSLTFNIRYERPWFGATLPLTFLPDVGAVGLGLQLRLGPVFVGSNNLINIVGPSAKRNFASFYAGASIIIPHIRPKDSDGDHVSDKVDLCPQSKGDFENKGCPDRDGDQIYDYWDDCPDVPGLESMNGCPDADLDNVPDAEDECPNMPGLAKFNGCPDDDGDGVPYPLDECEEDAGPAAYLGCPDVDGDGIPIPFDQCPQQAGLAKNNGCPDSDNDGTIDKEDECPDVAGETTAKGCPDKDSDGVKDSKDKCDNTGSSDPVNERGCPNRDNDACDEYDDADDYVAGPEECGCVPCEDSDEDGIPDKDDSCPYVKGPRSNRGCPDVEPIRAVASGGKMILSVPFNPGSPALTLSAEKYIRKLIDKKLNDPQYADGRLIVRGWADETDGIVDLDQVAERRALAVFNFLSDNGIYKDDIELGNHEVSKDEAGNNRVVKVYYVVD